MMKCIFNPVFHVRSHVRKYKWEVTKTGNMFTAYQFFLQLCQKHPVKQVVKQQWTG